MEKDEETEIAVECSVLDVCLFFPEVNVNQAELCSIADQFNGIVETELVHNVGTVVFNGLGADKKLFSNFFAGKPFRHNRNL